MLTLYGDSYENKIGFGHEEWLLDDSRIYEPDGYHCAFLQPLNVESGKHIGEEYDIHLFTISPFKQKVYVGCLHHAIGVSPEESEKVFQYYKETLIPQRKIFKKVQVPEKQSFQDTWLCQKDHLTWCEKTKTSKETLT